MSHEQNTQGKPKPIQFLFATRDPDNKIQHRLRVSHRPPARRCPIILSVHRQFAMNTSRARAGAAARPARPPTQRDSDVTRRS
ncbi:hypothetical protein EVAR_91425_1 [Eumeta japonica]|uniref:Uncharacterized protein n=1 Tax=Eumeta variegata TaxID=151549 RepID=A0A4C1X0T4_EUMVA|nr:hypothetical protein EVAR_91425_1 [Eumeta japonica]